MDRISRKHAGLGILLLTIMVAGLYAYPEYTDTLRDMAISNESSSADVQQWRRQVETITYWDDGEDHVIDDQHDQYQELKLTLVQALANYGGRLQEHNMRPCFPRFRNGTAVEITFDEPIYHTEPPYNGSSRSFIFRLDSESKIHPGCSAFVSDLNWQDDVKNTLMEIGVMDGFSTVIEERTEQRRQTDEPVTYAARNRITDDPQNYYSYTTFPDSYYSYYSYHTAVVMRPKTTDTVTLRNVTLYLPVPAAGDVSLTDDILADTEVSDRFSGELLNLSLVNTSRGTMFAVRLDEVMLPPERQFIRYVEAIPINRSINTVDPLENELIFRPANYTDTPCQYGGSDRCRVFTAPVYINYTGPAIDVQVMTRLDGVNEWGDVPRQFQRIHFNSYQQAIPGELLPQQQGWGTVSGRFVPAAGMYPDQHCTLKHRECTCYGGLGTEDENNDGVACAGETECRIETENIC